jgi:hypothetical protein
MTEIDDQTFACPEEGCDFHCAHGYQFDDHKAQKHTVVYTIDGHKVVDGMRAWDYDLERVVVLLDTAKPEHNGDIWFYCQRLTNRNAPHDAPEGFGRSLMNGSRLWVRHPRTGEKA